MKTMNDEYYRGITKNPYSIENCCQSQSLPRYFDFYYYYYYKYYHNYIYYYYYYYLNKRRFYRLSSSLSFRSISFNVNNEITIENQCQFRKPTGSKHQYRRRSLFSHSLSSSSLLFAARCRPLIIDLFYRVLLNFVSIAFSLLHKLSSLSPTAMFTLLIIRLLTTSIVFAACNVKTMADTSQWGNLAMAGDNDNGRGGTEYTIANVHIQPSVDPPRAPPRLPPEAIAISGYPSAMSSPHSMSRQRLLQLINNPAFRRPNMDDLPVHVMVR